MNPLTAAMAELARARKELSTWLYKGVTGSRVHERVAQLVDDHQSAVKDVHAHHLAEQIREAGSHLGHNTNLAYRRAADIIDPFAGQRCNGNRTPAPAATELETSARVFAALHHSAEQDVTRVIDLYEQWVKAGPPPLGTSMSRWWDARLVELRAALDEEAATVANRAASATLTTVAKAVADAASADQKTFALAPTPVVDQDAEPGCTCTCGKCCANCRD